MSSGARRVLALAAATFAAGCGTLCEEAAQICADEGRSAAPNADEDAATCEGAVESRAECIANAESCAPDVVDACASRTAEEGAGNGAEAQGARAVAGNER